MHRFLRKLIVALLIVALFHAAAGYLADGSTDEFYLRFTVGPQRSLILGGSRAAQGLHPDVFNTAGGMEGFEGPLYDFSFTMAHSPYGRTYLEAVEHLVDPATRQGLFILQVDPWLISDPATGPAEPEAERALGTQITWNARPNYEYLVRHWDRGWGALGHWPMGDPDTSLEVLPDGRLELHLSMEADTVLRRTADRVRTYREDYLPGRVPSDQRYSRLRELVAYLREHGTVVLVRLPVCEQIANMEDTLDPRFNERMRAIEALDPAFAPRREQGMPPVRTHYIRLDTMAANFTDGNHLDEASGRRVSEALRQAIQHIVRSAE